MACWVSESCIVFGVTTKNDPTLKWHRFDSVPSVLKSIAVIEEATSRCRLDAAPNQAHR